MGVETALLISAGVSAVGSLAQASAASQALANDIKRYEDEKKYNALRALQEENSRNEAMNITLANNRVIAGASGILDDSRSFLTIQKDVFDSAKKDIANIRLNKNIAQSKYDQQIINSQIERQNVFYGGIFNASTSLINGWAYYDYYGMSKPKTTGTVGTSPSGQVRGISGGMYGGGV